MVVRRYGPLTGRTAPLAGRHEAWNLLEPRSEEIVQRRHGDLGLSLDAELLRRGGQSLLEKLLEALLTVPELHDPVAEAHSRGEMEVDPASGPRLNAHVVEDSPVFLRSHVGSLTSDHEVAAPCASSPATAEAPAPTSQLSGAVGR